MKKGGLLVLGVILLYALFLLHDMLTRHHPTPPSGSEKTVSEDFDYGFDSTGTLEETEKAELSTSPYWWLDSGGLMTLGGGVGRTNVGDLSNNNFWHTLYAKNNPADTDSGAHPQNLFRLITKGAWHNVSQQAFFNINTYNVSSSTNRNESNGLLLLSRYSDEKDLYYAGIRVDGYAVIKKKSNGTYYTLIQKQIFPGTYDRTTNPNLLPLHTWIGLKTTITTLPDKTVHLELSMRRGNGDWQQILETTDTGTDAPVIDTTAHAGIRTDFMDVQFDNYSVKEI